MKNAVKQDRTPIKKKVNNDLIVMFLICFSASALLAYTFRLENTQTKRHKKKILHASQIKNYRIE